MHFVGVDLAWGQRAWTGLAALDDRGQLLDVDRGRGDDDVAGWIARYAGSGAVVAFDAPLVVRNATGRRPCEAEVTRRFGRHHAGAHPSNLGLPAFRDGSRAARLAAALELEVDPFFAARTPTRSAVEVYPHPATITLFGWARIAPYKARAGRTPATRRTALLALVSAVEGLAAAEPPLLLAGEGWREVRAAVDAAGTHAALDRWEDPVDAVLCAYLGWHRWWHGDAASEVIGDVDTGYIVVPRPPRGASPAVARADPDRADVGGWHAQ